MSQSIIIPIILLVNEVTVYVYTSFLDVSLCPRSHMTLSRHDGKLTKQRKIASLLGSFAKSARARRQLDVGASFSRKRYTSDQDV